MKALKTKDDVYGLLGAPIASAAMGASIKTGLLWMLAEKPMDGDEVAQAPISPANVGIIGCSTCTHWGFLK